MDIVEQIAKAVLPKVLSNPAAQEKESGLVSQFIAIFASKVAGTDNLSINANDTGASIIQSVFTEAEERGELITKLAESHGVDETTTQGLLAKAAPLVTGELTTLSGGGSIQEFLKGHLPSLGGMLPEWSTSLLPAGILGGLGAIGAGVAGLGGKVGDIAGGVTGAAGDLAGGVTGKVGDLAGGVTGKIGDVAGGLGDAAGNLTGKVGDVAGNVTGAAGDLAGNVTGKIGDVAGGAADLAGDAAGKVGDLAGGAVGKVGDLGAGAAAGVAGAAGATAAAGGGLMKKLFPILGLIGLGLIGLFAWKSCSGKPDTAPVATDDATAVEAPATPEAETPAAPTVDEATLSDAQFNLATGEGDAVFACSGNVGDEGLKGKITGAVSAVFGSADKCADIKVDNTYKTTLANEDKLQEAFAAVKEVPDASINIVGGEIVVNAKDPAAKAALVEKLKGILPEYNITEAAALDKEAAVKQGVEGSLEALSALEAKGSATGSEIAKALNIQVINFATNKYDIPAANQQVLDKAATLLTSNPSAKLEVTGHTDSRGNAAANQTLSENRAKSVMDYLVSKGAAATQLTSKGVGSNQPVASDATPEGQFQNRRISFDANATAMEAMTGAVEGAAGAVTGAAGAVTGGAGDALGAVADVAGGAVEGVADAGAAIAEGAADAAGAAVEGTADVAGAAVEGVADAGAAIVEGAADTAGAAVEGTADAAAATAEVALDSVDAAVEAGSEVLIGE